MRYFHLEMDAAYFPVPQPVAWNGLFNSDNLRQGNSHVIPKRQILRIDNNANLNYIDFITAPFLLVSDNVRGTMQLYDNSIIFKEFVLLDSIARRSDPYFTPILPELECLSDKSESNLDKSSISRIVIKEKAIAEYHFFRIKEAQSLYIIGSLDFVESLFRRNVRGLKLNKIELD